MAKRVSGLTPKATAQFFATSVALFKIGIVPSFKKFPVISFKLSNFALALLILKSAFLNFLISSAKVVNEVAIAESMDEIRGAYRQKYPEYY